MEYRLIVVASSVLDVVTAAGGYLFDQSMAGWRVTAAVTSPSASTPDDDVPLAILGVATANLRDAVGSMHGQRSAGVVAVCAELYDRDEVVRSLTAHADVDLLLWNRAPDADATVRHRLSHAAKAFKSRALAATGSPTTVAPTECFRAALPVDGRPKA